MKEIALEKRFLNLVHFYEYPLWISMIIGIYISLLLAIYLSINTLFYNVNNVSSRKIEVNIIKSSVLGQYSNLNNNTYLNPEAFLNSLYSVNIKQSDSFLSILDNKEKDKIIADIKEKQKKRRLDIIQKQNQYIINGQSVITAYSSDVYQCDSTPCVTANGFNVCQHGEMDTIATNHLKFGTKVKIPEIFGDRIFIVRDRMNRRYKDRVDVWMTNRYDAIQFGIKKATIYVEPVITAPVYFE